MKTKNWLNGALVGSLLTLGSTSLRAQNQNMTGRDLSATTQMSTATRETTATGRDLAISAAKSANHTVLFRALRMSGLTEQASAKGPYTVFAPTNEAFGKLPAGTMDELLKPAARAKLTKILAYHIIKGKYTAEQLQDGQKLKTAMGGTLTVGKQGDTLTITDGAGNTAIVAPTDAEATNGMVFSIDTVLMSSAGDK